MTVLITGAFGFVGTNLSAFLADRGIETWALDVRQAVAAGKGSPYARRFDWEQLYEIPWREIDAVIHLAGKAHDTRNTSDAKSYFDVNVGLTKKVIQSAMGSGQWAVGSGQQAAGTVETRKESSIPEFQHPSIPVKTFILFSSVKAVADRVEGVLTEDALPDPQTPYGKSKLEAEQFVQSVVGGRQSAIRSYILRPCMIHGPGNKGNMNLLYGMVRKGIPWPLGGFENRRSFASIGNVCAVVEGLLAGEVAQGVYQVADDEAFSTNELVRLIAETLGRRVRIWRIPSGLVRAAAKVGDVLRLPLNSERLRKLTESYEVSNAKIKRALGWMKMPVRAEDGIRRTLESFGQ